VPAVWVLANPVVGKTRFAGEPAPTRSTCTSRYRDAGLVVVGASLLVPAVWVLANPVVGKHPVRGQGRSYKINVHQPISGCRVIGCRSHLAGESGGWETSGSRPRPLLQASCLQQWDEFVGAPTSGAMYYNCNRGQGRSCKINVHQPISGCRVIGCSSQLAGEFGARETSGSRPSPLLQASCLQQWDEFVGAPTSGAMDYNCNRGQGRSCKLNVHQPVS